MQTIGGTKETNGGTQSKVPEPNAAAARGFSRRDVLKGMAVGGGMMAGAAVLPWTGRFGARSSPLPLVRSVERSLGPDARASLTRSGTLKFGNLDEPNFIDPAQVLEVSDDVVADSVYDGLTALSVENTEIVPSLALSWTMNTSATKVVMQLRPGVKFQDGTPFDSTAVRLTCEHFLKNVWAGYLGDLHSIDDSDPMAVTFTFNEPNPDFIRGGCTEIRIISPALLAENAASKRAVGTGPFMWSEWIHGERVVLSANPDYWGSPEPYVDVLELITVPEETARIEGLESGSLDLVARLAPSDAQVLEGSPGVTVARAVGWTNYNVTFNCLDPITGDVRVRQAIAYAINKEEIVRDIEYGYATVADQPIPAGCYGHSAMSVGYDYNLAKAKKLLQAAGYGRGVSLSMVGGSGLGEDLIGEAIVGMLAEVGITLTWTVGDIGVVVSDMVSAHPHHQAYMLTHGWGGYPLHYDITDIFTQPHYTGKELLSLAHLTTVTVDGPKRLALLTRTENLFMQELPDLPLFYADEIDGYRTSVHGFVPDKNDYDPLFKGVYLS